MKAILACVVILLTFTLTWVLSEPYGITFWDKFFDNLGRVSLPLVIGALCSLIGARKNYLTRFSIWTLLAGTVFMIANRIATSAEDKIKEYPTCPISALFGAQPKVQNIDLPGANVGVVAWKVTELYSDGFSSLECYIAEPKKLFGDASFISVLESIARQNRETQDGIFADNSISPHSKMNSSKSIDGRDVYIERHLFKFENAVVIASTASETRAFPTKSNLSFIQSLKLTVVEP
jgi:hypothetical protein